jgi:hypothetical protein
MLAPARLKSLTFQIGIKIQKFREMVVKVAISDSKLVLVILVG